MEDYGICVDGETEYEGNKYTQHIELPISESVMNDIEDYIHPYILQQGFKESTLKEAVRFLITTL